MDKQFTSNTEDKRLNIEEPELTIGKRILPQQVWRDGALIPGSPDDLEFSIPEIENGLLVSYNYFKDGQTVHSEGSLTTTQTIKQSLGSTQFIQATLH